MSNDDHPVEENQGPWEAKTSVWKIGTLAALAAALVAVVTLQSTPYSVARSEKMDDALGEFVSSVAPQGWAFFTKTAKEPTVVPFNTDGVSVSLLPNARPGNIFGISRKGRAQGVEIGYIQQRVEQDTHWEDCESRDAGECARESSMRHDGKHLPRVDNDLDKATLCGDLVFVEVEPVPYSYRSSTRLSTKANRAIAFHANC